MERSKIIFGNEIAKKDYKKALKSKKKFIKKYGDDSKVTYHLKPVPISEISELNIDSLVLGEETPNLDEKGIIIGNIRMGFGHYRISLAIASCANALGYKPYWFDLLSYKSSTGSKMIEEQNKLYSLGSRLSQMSKLFNKFVWEPVNTEMFRQLSYNVVDQKNSEILAPLYHDLPKDMPFVATHVWPSQGAIHAGMTHVVNAIPDNWPMALHLSEGAIHTVQTPYAYLGYKILNGMDKKRKLKPIADEYLYMVGNYVDHELVSNIEIDCEKRIKRQENNEPVRFLITVGGAGAGKTMYRKILEHLIPLVKDMKATVLLNVGDHYDVLKYFEKSIKGFKEEAIYYIDEYASLKEFAEKMDDEVLSGIRVIGNKNIFEAVYSTNLLMRHSDVLITKPSELSFYPIPKIFNKHIGGHEKHGAYFASQLGDSTWEVEKDKDLLSMIDTLIDVRSIIKDISKRIIKLKEAKYYDGGYEVVKLAVNGRK